MHDVSPKFEISTLKNVCFIDVQKYAPNMLPHTTGTLAPDVFGNSDALRGIAHRTMWPQTIHKQFLMSGQRFQLNSGRFQGKSVSELLKTLCASVSASSKSTFSTTQKHFFPVESPWMRLKSLPRHQASFVDYLYTHCPVGDSTGCVRVTKIRYVTIHNK